MPISNAKAKLIRRDELTENVTELEFEMINPKELNFRPGQYITIKIDNQTRRQYSISSSPLKSKSKFTVTYDKRPNGIGVNFLNNLQIDDEIEFIGEIGLFTLPDNLSENIYFFATGVGIAPLKSMIETLVLSGEYKNHNIHLIWGTRYKDWIIYEDLFKNYLQKGYIKEYEIYLTKEKVDGYKNGRLTNYIKNNDFENDSQFFVCGSGKAISGIVTALKKKGIYAEAVYYEKFF